MPHAFLSERMFPAPGSDPRRSRGSFRVISCGGRQRCPMRRVTSNALTKLPEFASNTRRAFAEIVADGAASYNCGQRDVRMLGVRIRRSAALFRSMQQRATSVVRTKFRTVPRGVDASDTGSGRPAYTTITTSTNLTWTNLPRWHPPSQSADLLKICLEVGAQPTQECRVRPSAGFRKD